MNLASGTPISQQPTGTVIFGNDLLVITHGITGSPNPPQTQGVPVLLFDGRYQPSGTASPSIVEGRLSLASGTPVPTTDQTAKTSIWYNPYIGNRISLYDGSTWQSVTVDVPKSVAVPSVSGTNFDIFGYASGGALALETVNWTNGTTRATALTTQNGVLVKSGDATRRYLGTGRAAATGQCEDSRTKRFLWNYYNRVSRPLNFTIGTSSWSYTSAAWRQANADVTAKVEIVVGWVEDLISLKVVTSVTGGTNASATLAEDVTNAPHADAHQQGGSASPAGVWVPFGSTLDCYPSSVGYHYYAWIEYGNTSVVFYGGTSSDFWRGGIHGLWRN